jgi:hypothetical protein
VFRGSVYIVRFVAGKTVNLLKETESMVIIGSSGGDVIVSGYGIFSGFVLTNPAPLFTRLALWLTFCIVYL